MAPSWVSFQIRVVSRELMQMLQAAQVADEAVSTFKAPSNSGLPRPWITKPATEPSLI